MKKFSLFLLFFAILSFSASAQWYNISLKKHIRYPMIAEVKDRSIERLPVPKMSRIVQIPKLTFQTETDYHLELAENSVMKIAQHNMRFREYFTASYNFSDLAALYVKQNRLSEAKWYFLQSNNISRQQNDDKHTITNLMSLAMVKAQLGDLLQSQQDLDEAHQIALLHAWTTNMADIEKEQKFIKLNITASTPKMELRYASDALITDKKAGDKKTD